ncbi:MAG: aminodeoxychorismate synthase component I [Moorea sp. SIO4E2]|nr:aminodeoxychorismate synthase component I [Moorena sp. SIO4E2]
MIFNIHSRKLTVYPDSERVFVHLFGSQPTAFWLDSSRVEPGLSRFSFMGDGTGPNSLLVQYSITDQKLTINCSGQTTHRRESIFSYLHRELERRYNCLEGLPFDFNCGFVGYFGYELKAECGGNIVHQSQFPDAMFLLADRIIAFDHQEQVTYLLCLTKKGETEQTNAWFEGIEKQLCTLPPLPPIELDYTHRKVSFRLSRSYQRYLEDIQESLDQIKAGESYEICLTNKIYANIELDPLAFYRRLRQLNPAPYSAFLKFGELAVACSSPERFLKIDPSGWVESKPIKGTAARGQTEEEDRLLCEALRTQEKNRCENIMIVDLLRNDLGRVCEIGSVHVPKLMDVETYATVHQLVSTIRGRLRPDVRVGDCIRATFPGGSMTGAPKISTMEIIDRLELQARGIYSGAIGFLALNGAADLNIVIRTAEITPNQVSIGIGGALIALSNPQLEFEETLLKAEALVRGIVYTVCGEFSPELFEIVDTPVAKSRDYSEGFLRV